MRIPSPVMRRSVVLGATIAFVGAALFAYWAVSGRSPNLTAAQEQALRASITRHLEQGMWRGALASRPEQRVQWVCAEHVIEVRQDRDEYRVGLLAMCDEFTAADGSLFVGSGTVGPHLAVVRLGSESAEVVRLESAPDGAGHGEWVRANFSRSGTAEVHRRQGRSSELWTATLTKARKVFGLPADAPVRR